MIITRGNVIVAMAMAGLFLASGCSVKPPAGARVTEDGWFAPIKPTRAKPTLPKKITRSCVITIDDVITPILLARIKVEVAKCLDLGAEIVIFDMDTPGGSMNVMDRIVHIIRSDLESVYTITYINSKALAAGAMIALACDEIALSPHSQIGGMMMYTADEKGEPIKLPELVRAKYDSAMRSEMRSLAIVGGYDEVLCEAMVDLSMVVWLLKNPETGQLKFVNAADWTGIDNAPLGELGNPAQKPLPEQGWEYFKTFEDAKHIINLDTEQAIYCGFTKHTFDSIDELKNCYNITSDKE